jgi:kynurenine aminotransferase
VVVLSDEVYDFLTFDNREHLLFANFNNNWNKTISTFSGGKLFSATGWKVGWTIGPSNIIRLGGIISNTTYYCFSAPM